MLYKKEPPKLKKNTGFTIVELLTVIVVIGILAAISVVAFGSWRSSTAISQIKNDLNAAVASFNDYRNFNDRYPIPDDFTSPPKFKFSPSSGVSIDSVLDDPGGKSYCIWAWSTSDPSLSYRVTDTNPEPQSGLCP